MGFAKSARLHQNLLDHNAEKILLLNPVILRGDYQGYSLSRAIEMLWLEDGDHDLKPRKSVSGFTAADHQKAVSASVVEWTGRLRG
ncbi:alpha/beta family hydrolase [Aquamicrobium ahrensii]|uniref:alpha/beta family hydrolase n=1 Tax=Aquamicrobium ahrensii TaxID=469551 RepID=UPI00360FC2F5